MRATQDDIKDTSRLMLWVDRSYRLVFSISLILMLLGTSLIPLVIDLGYWRILMVLSCAIPILGLNLWLLRIKKNTTRAAHVMILTFLIVIICGYVWMGNIRSMYFAWFYIPPVMAAITLGPYSLLFYGAISLGLNVYFYLNSIQPLYLPNEFYTHLINFIHPIFILTIIVTALYHLLHENKEHEKVLVEQNFRLNAEKQKFHYLSRHDSLTNLPNRSYFLSQLQAVLDIVTGKAQTVTIFFMDLNGFKTINDRYGHEVGDQLLMLTAKRLQSCFRESDFLARIGGDEFTAMVITNKKDKTAQFIVQRIKQEFEQPFAINRHSLHCNISIGTASYPADGITPDDLIRVADFAMYQAKNGKNPEHS